MTITTLGAGAAITPVVVKTYVSHYVNRNPRRQKPTAHISYDEGLHLIRKFLDYASHKTVDDLQAFTARWVPHPSWIRTENVLILPEHTSKAADAIVSQLGSDGVKLVGGSKWWQWRRKENELKAEWIEMRSDYNNLKKSNTKSKRVMLYVHGGAYFFGSVDEHRYQMQRHARKLKARVFAPRYRLAPQFPFPCGLHDCLAAYLHLLALHDSSEIILAGDSAGGGMIVSMLCILRDQHLPMPAGAILISPWVDLTHSFPSVAEGGNFDYIPPHGFMHKPSTSWPPPNEDEIEAMKKTGDPKDALKEFDQEKKHNSEQKAAQGFTEHEIDKESGIPTRLKTQHTRETPLPNHQLSIELDGKLVFIKDQIQMYTTNQLLSHPLVSPVLQPTLGGLPPLLILTGGGEILRDEQIYLAHKAANPSKYPLGEHYNARYDPSNDLIDQYKPTPVQLQVWEDLCHVTPTLSFTRPAKFMYRSIAQFGAWALARAQKTAIEIDDDNISITSSSSESDSETDKSRDDLEKQQNKINSISGSIGRAGDSLPPFKNHMIRQKIDRHGIIYPLESAHDLAAFRMDANQIGLIKPGPVRNWMSAKQEWDTRYASIKRRVQKQRLKEWASGQLLSFGEDEIPPPSALAGRRTNKQKPEKKNRKSYGLAMWSMWGSKHDEGVLKREGNTTQQPEKEELSKTHDTEVEKLESRPDDRFQERRNKSTSRSRRGSSARRKNQDRSLSHRRTISVVDQGQTEGNDDELMTVPTVSTKTYFENPNVDTNEQQTITNSSQNHNTSHLTPGFIPKFKNPPHLRQESRDFSDAASTKTGISSMISQDDASTRAIFSVSGISKQHNQTDKIDQRSIKDADDDDDFRPTTSRKMTILDGSDTPRSEMSLERLRTNNVGNEDEDVNIDSFRNGDHLRSPSNIAVVRADGVVGIVPEEEEEDFRN